MSSVDAATLRGLALFAGLSDAQLAELVAAGHTVAIEPGGRLFSEGDPADHWWVLVDGQIDLVRQLGREETLVARMDQSGQWAGGFRAWDEHGVYLATGRGARAGAAFSIPASSLRELLIAWFPFGTHVIGGLFTTARSIESTARQRGALITLGTLAAGLAHEINNPAAAATRAVEGLGLACDTLLTSLGQLAHAEITAAQFATLDELRKALADLEPIADPLDRSDLTQELGGWLAERGAPEPHRLAASLATAGATLAWCEQVAAATAPSPSGPAFQWLASTADAASLLADVKEATRRISELVGAVRSYSQVDRASMQRVDVTDGIDSTLVMLGHKLRDGVEVVRDYGPDVPEIEAYPGELNQVWTNLVDNAVDAMGGHGRLRVTTRVDGLFVVVEIADSAGALDPAASHRAFEAFFTTKDVGKGTGLGLDIAHRIVVDRHGGAISLQSDGGETVATVRLPIR